MSELIPTLAVLHPRISVIELVALAKPMELKSALRKHIVKTGVEVNAALLKDPEEQITVKTNDILRTGPGEWFRIEIVKLNDLETDRLMLKTLHIEDVDLLQKYLPEWEIVKYLTTPESMKKGALPQKQPDEKPSKVSKHVAREVFKRVIMQPEPKSDFLWKIMQKVEPEKIIGVAHLHNEPDGDATQNFWLDPALRDENLLSEAMSAVNEHAFSNMGVSNIVFQKAFAHAAAPLEMENLRFRFIGMDADARNRDEPIGAWGVTKEGWDKMKDWMRPGQSRGQRGQRAKKTQMDAHAKNIDEQARRSFGARKTDEDRAVTEKQQADIIRAGKMYNDKIFAEKTMQSTKDAQIKEQRQKQPVTPKTATPKKPKPKAPVLQPPTAPVPPNKGGTS